MNRMHGRDISPAQSPQGTDFHGLTAGDASEQGSEDIDPARSSGPAELYRAAYPRIMRALMLAASSEQDAQEATQDAFVQLVLHWKRISAYEDPEAWTRAVAFRLLSNKNRRARRAAKFLHTQQPPAAHLLDIAGVELREALRALPLEQRQVLVLHYLLDMRVDRIARDLHIKEGTVKSRLSRGRSALKSHFEEQTHE